MRTFDICMNYLEYDINASFLPQVDVKIMELIFEKFLQELSFYSDKDSFVLKNNDNNSLFFLYSSTLSSGKLVSFNGCIYAQKPRKDFDFVDLLSYMKIEMIKPDDNNEIIDAISGIVQAGYIEEVHVGHIHNEEIAELLKGIKGKRNGRLYTSLVLETYP